MILLRYLDANCLVKLVVSENGSNELRTHFFQDGIVCATTTFCFYEALGVLKTKLVNKKRPAIFRKSSIWLHAKNCVRWSKTKTFSWKRSHSLTETRFVSRSGWRPHTKLICPMPFNW